MTRMALGARLMLALALILPALSGGSVVAQSPPIDRTVLPIAEPRLSAARPNSTRATPRRRRGSR